MAVLGELIIVFGLLLAAGLISAAIKGYLNFKKMALVAEYQDPQTGECEILGVCRGSKQHGINEGEFAMLVNDQWQNQGLGTELLKRLLEVGKDEKLDRITVDILSENRAMQHICQKLGFEIRRGMDVVTASYEYPDRVC